MAGPQAQVPPGCGKAQLFHILEELDIQLKIKEYDSEHPVDCDDDGKYCKNLVLKDRKGQFYLVIVPIFEKVDLKKLKSLVGAYRNFSFASSDDLENLLKSELGSVSPFNLLFDTDHKLRVIFDLSLKYCASPLHFHPLDGQKTASLPFSNLVRFLHHLGYQEEVVEIANH